MKRLCLTFCALLAVTSFMHAQEVYVSMKTGESFQLTVDENETFFEVTEKIRGLIDESLQLDEIVFEVPLSETDEVVAKTSLWDIVARKQGGNLGYPRDYSTAITNEETSDIHYIITMLANRSLLTILKHKLALEAAGDRVDHVHPFRFLECVFTNEERKAGIRNIRNRGWIWGDFLGGLKDSLSTEAENDNLRDKYILDFAASVKINPNLIIELIHNRKWNQFVDTLITHIPRKGDHDRYDD